jgi:hypothetical protein
MLKFRHLRLRVRALKPAAMRRREPTQILLLPLAVDLVHFPAKIEVQQGADIEIIGRSKSKSKSKSMANKMMKRGRRISGLPLHEANLGLLRIQKRNPRRCWLPSR